MKTEFSDPIKLKILGDEKKISNCVLCIKNYRYVRDSFFMQPEDSSETKEAKDETLRRKRNEKSRGIKYSLLHEKKKF